MYPTAQRPWWTTHFTDGRDGFTWYGFMSFLTIKWWLCMLNDLLLLVYHVLLITENKNEISSFIPIWIIAPHLITFEYNVWVLFWQIVNMLHSDKIKLWHVCGDVTIEQYQFARCWWCVERCAEYFLGRCGIIRMPICLIAHCFYSRFSDNPNEFRFVWRYISNCFL